MILITIWWCKNQGKNDRCKQAARKFDVERFNLRKVDELEVRRLYQIKISHMSIALEKLNVSDDVNWVWENIKENVKISAIEGLYELEAS